MATNKTIEEKLKEGRSYRDISLASFERRTEEEGKMMVTGYATTFNDPYLLYDFGDYRVIEQVDPNAFDDCEMDDVIMQYDHQGRVFARKSNGTLKVAPDEKGLRIEAELSGTEIGRQLYEEIDGGYTTKMSFGFRVSKDKTTYEEDTENNVTTVYRTITGISRLYDVSAVSLPANDGTSISARSEGEGVIAGIIEEIEERKKREEQKARIKAIVEGE